MKIVNDLASNRLLSEKYDLPPHLLNVLDNSTSLSFKLAAWNERRLVRDIYDICFFIKIGISINREALLKRLKKTEYSKKVTKEDDFKGNSIADFLEFLQEKVNALSAKMIEEELGGVLSMQSLVGIDIEFRSFISRLK